MHYPKDRITQFGQNKKQKKNKKGKKIGKRISCIIRKRLHTSTKVEVCEYHELCLEPIIIRMDILGS